MLMAFALAQLESLCYEKPTQRATKVDTNLKYGTSQKRPSYIALPLYTKLPRYTLDYITPPLLP